MLVAIVLLLVCCLHRTTSSDNLFCNGKRVYARYTCNVTTWESRVNNLQKPYDQSPLNDSIHKIFLDKSNYDITTIRDKKVLVIGNSHLRSVMESFSTVYAKYIDEIRIANHINKISIGNYMDNEFAVQNASKVAACTLNLAEMKMYGNVHFYTSVNSAINNFLHSGDGIHHLLDYFNVSLVEVDMIIMNSGNSVNWAKQFFKTQFEFEKYDKQSLTTMHNIPGVLKELERMHYRGKVILLPQNFGVDDNHLRPYEKYAWKGEMKVNYIDLRYFFTASGACSYPDCGNDPNAHQCEAGPPHDMARMIVALLKNTTEKKKWK